MSLVPSLRLEGKVALITGAGGAVGAATARRFAREGALVALNDLASAGLDRLVAEITDDAGRALITLGDVTSKPQVDRMVRETVETFGRVDILVNNAAVTREAAAGVPGERAIDVNLEASALCAQAVLPGMRERGWGRVVNTSSVERLARSGQTADAASKAGVITLTRALALEYARDGITVNCVARGATMTAMQAAERGHHTILARIPMGRGGDPREIAAAHLFLASDEASFITGQVLFVDGGMSVGT